MIPNKCYLSWLEIQPEEHKEKIGKLVLWDDVKEAVYFYEHLIGHREVQESEIHKGLPMCKICGLSSKQILKQTGDINE